jgi:hypothetical protein
MEIPESRLQIQYFLESGIRAQPWGHEMNGWMVKDPWIFYGIASLVLSYVIYMMIRRRKGERPGVASRELEL